jgi:hypothetical protein
MMRLRQTFFSISSLFFKPDLDKAGEIATTSEQIVGLTLSRGGAKIAKAGVYRRFLCVFCYSCGKPPLVARFCARVGVGPLNCHVSRRGANGKDAKGYQSNKCDELLDGGAAGVVPLTGTTVTSPS